MAAVVDASSLGDFLRGARRSLPEPPIHIPALCDIEIASQLRLLMLRGRADLETTSRFLTHYLGLPLRRHGHVGLLDRVLELRDNFTPYDAAYVALAERLGLPLLTADAPLRRAVEEHLPQLTLL